MAEMYRVSARKKARSSAKPFQKIIVGAMKGKAGLLTGRSILSALTELRFFVPNLLPGNMTPPPAAFFDSTRDADEECIFPDVLGNASISF